MNQPVFESSDSLRSARPLRHARTCRLSGPLALERGGRLEEVLVTYETYGRLDEARDNAVLICHALSGDSHVARHDEDDEPGWWDIAVGPGKAIDTDRFFVICSNVLGGCRGTTGPNSIDPATGECYGPDFPEITIGDMVEVQRRLLDELGIERVLAVVGGSMGGHQAMLWAIRHPGRVGGAVLIATSTRLSSQALAFDIVGRNAILRDADFHGGRYQQRGRRPSVGLAIARMIGHITYLSREAMEEKFDDQRTAPRDVPVAFEKDFAVGSYLGYQGAKFVERFDANSYIVLTRAMDLFDLGGSAEEFLDRVRPSRCRWLVISFADDWLFSPEESRRIVRALIAAGKPVSYCNVASRAGHDAFLLPDDLDAYGGLVGGFLGSLAGLSSAGGPPGSNHACGPASIFYPESPQRLDYDRIIALLSPSASVLDLGCGSGELLDRLRRRGHSPLMGVERDEQAVIACVRWGLDVIQADLNEQLSAFADKQFDFVILSQTLQSILDVEGLIEEMLRVARRCIVSFPNFGHHEVRRTLCKAGRMPQPPGESRHKWYNTPNLRFLTIADFREFCREKHIRIHRCACLDSRRRRDVADDEDCNLHADIAIFVVSR
ncbi:MAG: homoserine O-acetyltransferase [Planctomycetes bacterium]|nr:homoserine O-acetyltransferase [Planctomycetota bacterium]